MSEEMLKEIADNAYMIIAGFSYTKREDGNISVLNLDKPDEASVLDTEGEMIETTMDDVTLCMAQAYYLKNREFMEVANA